MKRPGRAKKVIADEIFKYGNLDVKFLKPGYLVWSKDEQGWVYKDNAGMFHTLTDTASSVQVSSVFGRIGAVLAQPGDYSKSDIGLSNVDNTSDLNSGISTDTQTALDDKVDNSRVLTDVPVGAVFTDTIYSSTKSALRLATPYTHNISAGGAFEKLQFDEVRLVRGNITALATGVDHNITIGKDGWYEIVTGLNGSWSSADNCDLMVFINGIAYSPNNIKLAGSGSNDPMIMHWTSTVQLTNGDVLDIRVKNDAGSAISINIDRLYFAIKEDK